jgi:hypothetical protein
VRDRAFLDCVFHPSFPSLSRTNCCYRKKVCLYRGDHGGGVKRDLTGPEANELNPNDTLLAPFDPNRRKVLLLLLVVVVRDGLILVVVDSRAFRRRRWKHGLRTYRLRVTNILKPT